MKKIIGLAAVAAGLIAVPAAEAHTGNLAIDCTGVKVQTQYFPAPATAHLTVVFDGTNVVVDKDIDVSGQPLKTQLVAFTWPDGRHGAEAKLTWTADGGGHAETHTFGTCQDIPAPPVPPVVPPVPPAPPVPPVVPPTPPVPPAPKCVAKPVHLKLVLPAVLPRTGPVTVRVESKGLRNIVLRWRSEGVKRWKVIGHGTTTLDTRDVASHTSDGHRKRGWQRFRVSGRNTCGKAVARESRRYSLDP